MSTIDTTRQPAITKKDRLASLLQRAHDAIYPKANIPGLFRRLLRRQGRYNRLLLEAVSLLSKNNLSMTMALRVEISGLRDQIHNLVANADDLHGQIARAGDHLLNLQRHADGTTIWQQTIRADIIHVGHRTERMLNTETSQHERQIDKLREAFTGENQRLREGISVGDQRLRDAFTIESQQLRDAFTDENKQFRDMVADLQTQLAAADVDRLRALIDELTTRLSVAQVEGLRDSLAEVKTVLSDRQAQTDQQIAKARTPVRR